MCQGHMTLAEQCFLQLAHTSAEACNNLGVLYHRELCDVKLALQYYERGMALEKMNKY
ncbi:unnamed protein product [Amoebophrya sp. A25]|nr:unnamed protein product [Amoebophrya sp. A25]CAD7972402.1 unnamed protein product [Amoebophrya sp. A25]|eukprot:GSA25T00024295001.1